jgi:hypothetical protein
VRRSEWDQAGKSAIVSNPGFEPDAEELGGVAESIGEQDAQVDPKLVSSNWDHAPDAWRAKPR